MPVPYRFLYFTITVPSGTGVLSAKPFPANPAPFVPGIGLEVQIHDTLCCMTDEEREGFGRDIETECPQ